MGLGGPAPLDDVSFGEASRFWIKLGFINFGVPTGQIAIMHDELVERRMDQQWTLPPRAERMHVAAWPEAQQLAVYVGWLLHWVRRGIVAAWLSCCPTSS